MFAWILILCLLLFFIFFSINKKEYFSVGGVDNINISSQLILDSNTCIECDETDKCYDGSNCFYDPSKIKQPAIYEEIVYNCSGNIINGKKKEDELCIYNTKDVIDNIVTKERTHFSFIKNLKKSDDILCTKGYRCNSKFEKENKWEEMYNKDEHNNDPVKKICDAYKELDKDYTIHNCHSELNIGICEKI